MTKTSFGEYFDDQRDRMRKDMQKKNTQQCIEWMERYEKRENQKMILNPLGYDAIKDIDEIQHRNRRKSDDPYIKATSEKIAHHFPKIDDAERR